MCIELFHKYLDLSKDIDECMGVNDCQQTCINTAGSYYRDCTDGFQLDSDEHRCTGTCDNYLQK